MALGDDNKGNTVSVNISPEGIKKDQASYGSVLRFISRRRTSKYFDQGAWGYAKLAELIFETSL